MDTVNLERQTYIHLRTPICIKAQTMKPLSYMPRHLPKIIKAGAIKWQSEYFISPSLAYKQLPLMGVLYPFYISYV